MFKFSIKTNFNLEGNIMLDIFKSDLKGKSDPSSWTKLKI